MSSVLDLSWWISVLSITVILAPLVLLAVLGLPPLLGYRLTEDWIDRSCRWATMAGFLAAVGILGLMLATGERRLIVDLITLAHVPEAGPDEIMAGTPAEGDFQFAFKYQFDRLSVPLVILTFALCGTVGAFANRYLHREGGYQRFFILYAVFLLGMVSAVLAATIETLFSGWELVGIASVLLIGFFHERPSPVRNAWRVWIVYRIADAALLWAAVVWHHRLGSGDFAHMQGTIAWPEGRSSVLTGEALGLGLLFLMAAAGKSGLIPFSGWLPRAMEGPTPSSAVFYGALSVHLGTFLLLRMNPLIAASELLAVVTLAWGLITSLFARLAAAVQADIKSTLAFASLTQVGLIVAEVGLGHWFPWVWYVALVHLLGHACLRTLQFLRAPTLLQDYRHLENAVGRRLAEEKHLTAPIPRPWSRWLYRYALERGYWDLMLEGWCVRPFVALFRSCTAMELRLQRWWAGEPNIPPLSHEVPLSSKTVPSLRQTA